MASIEIGPLSHHLDEDEVTAVHEALGDADVELDLDDEADSRLVEADIDEDILADFMDQLDANDAACDIYVPGDFEDVIEVGEYRIGSAHALLIVLEEIRDEIFEEEEDEEEEEAADDDEEYGDFEDEEEDEEGSERGYGRSSGSESARQLKDEVMRHLWKTVFKGAKTCIREGTCLFVHK